MPKNKAKKHFLGQDGHQRMNCADAVIAAFKDKISTEDKTMLCKGGGQAPGGVCGAYCAGKHILDKYASEKMAEFENFFTEKASSLNCKEIRQIRKLSCLGCVEQAADFVAKNCPL
ncbi:MAG: C-GCAxxG-C-C family protein [bacterium]